MLENVRMRISHQKMVPDHWMTRVTNIIKEVGYDSTYEEEVDRGLFSYKFSGGPVQSTLEIHMPFGDPITNEAL